MSLCSAIVNHSSSATVKRFFAQDGIKKWCIEFYTEMWARMPEKSKGAIEGEVITWKW